MSLLDRDLISQNVNNKEIDENFVQSMLGLADKSEILELLKSIISGEANQILTCSRALIEKGADIKSILCLIVSIIYLHWS